MNHLQQILLLVAACVLIETVEQMLYRMASRDRAHWWSFVLPAGVLHAAGLASWYLLLRLTPLSVALPLIGLNYVTIAMAARLIFGEPVDRRRWAGITTIMVGFAMVAAYCG